MIIFSRKWIAAFLVSPFPKEFLSKLQLVLWTVFLASALSSDVELNLGPVHLLYSVCYKSLHVNQHALLCDICVYWCCCGCCGVGTSRYIYFQKAGVFNIIAKCIADALPFPDCSVLGSDTFYVVSQNLNLDLLTYCFTKFDIFYWFECTVAHLVYYLLLIKCLSYSLIN